MRRTSIYAMAVLTFTTIAAADLETAFSEAKAASNTWNMHIVWVDARAEAQAYKRFADLASDAAGDELDIKVFTGGALGIKDVDILRILPAGRAVQVAGIYPGYLSRDEPEYSLTLPTGVVSQPETLVSILPQLTEIYETTYEKWGITLLGYVMHPNDQVHVFCKDPVNSLEGLKGKKLRVWERLQVEAFGELDVAAQIIPQNDLYVALQTGVVDCALYSPSGAQSISLHEVAPYSAYIFPYVLHPLHLIASTEALEQLSPEARAALFSAAQTVEKETTENYLAGTLDAEAQEELTEVGVTILPPFSEEDRGLYVSTARRLWASLSEEYGNLAWENYETITEAVQRLE